MTKILRYLPTIAIVTLTILTLLFGLSRKASGQAAEWNGPYRLSSSSSLVVTLQAATVADPYGNAHVFWIEERAGERFVTYAQFDGTAWSPQLDLFVSSAGLNIGSVLSASIDEAGLIHLAWLGIGGGPIFFTSVPAHRALSVQEWADVGTLDASALRVELQVDSNNVYHLVSSVVYDAQPGLHYRRSENGGKEWSPTVWLNPDIPAGYIPDTFQFTVDAKERLHVLWSEKEETGTTLGAGRIRYSRSVDGGNTWSPVTNLDVSNDGSRLLDNSEPSLVIYDDTVHAVWAGGEYQYRNQRTSTDGGQSWSNTTMKMFGELHGQAQGDALIADATGTVHYVGHIRWPEGMYYLRWDDGRWSEPELFYLIRTDSSELKVDKINAHGVRAALLRGNQLLVTFYDRADDGNYVLYGMSKRLADSAPAPIKPTPSVSAALTPTPEQTATPIATEGAPTATAVPTVTVDAPVAGENSPAQLLTQALLPALVVMVTVVAYSIRRRS